MSRRVLVTGAASGIGAEVARRFADAGDDVTSLDVKDPAVPVDRHVHCDLSEVDSIDAAVAALDGEFDALCNVAGVPGTAPAELVMRVNLLGLRHLTEAVVERIGPGGAVVNVASIAGYDWASRLDALRDLLATDTVDEGLAWFAANPQPGNAYNFSKEALIVYTMLMAPVFAENGVRMNAVCPGPVETPILGDFEESMGKENLDALAAFLGRHATPSDIAGPVTFLAGPDSSWINGHALVADGGISGAVLTGMVPAPQI
ncbi:coniferyl-alcohol dehydrogenase [Pseudonocardia endophytica]|uniref:NAD(P)-dependent dehydrogenase (Short-subunit alcohol dehydrogenase family) n=1 Tax=Pseudonocardia endophytica TaxID=401976 RepID=A0A4R1HF77_PSEEN|nr:coniferyl-alcohol dehydrogenase [Pseudonocardia endophytica]TCK20298.1 NAD(P)-dependent dehydrogenase (short-subunit alcohol dehydrogenase family) [Pseudonocardia endophytica]